MFVLHLCLVTKYPLLRLLPGYHTPQKRIPLPPPRAPKKRINRRLPNDDDLTSQTSATTPSTPQSYCADNGPWTVHRWGSSLDLSAQTKDGVCVHLTLHL
uniref:Protein E4 n=1 Tax=Human papillomavirus 67 TaxID=37120 RepID=A0A159DZ46_HPV67|nr:E4 [human papillomavirus 67]ALT54974.1 E4 [human papillomavirus 67]